MAKTKKTTKVEGRRAAFGAACRTVDLSAYLNWPKRVSKEAHWRALADEVGKYPVGACASWGIPFELAEGSGSGSGSGCRAILVADNRPDVTIRASGQATYLCFLHHWHQIPETVRREDPTEGLAVGEYEILYSDGARHVQPVRARFEVNMAESPGPPWQAVPFTMWQAVDPMDHPASMNWGYAQTGTTGAHGQPLLYAMENPHPEKRVRAVTIRGLQGSPLLVAGLTLYRGTAHPLAHLPRRTYRVKGANGPVRVEAADVDMGGVVRVHRTPGPRGAAWLKAPSAGTVAQEPDRGGEDLIDAFGARDSKLSVTTEDAKRPVTFSLGEAFEKGSSRSGRLSLEVQGKMRQWMQVRVLDRSTGTPTPVRIQFSGARGNYVAPYGHHEQINTNWFEDYGADVVVGGRNYAYVPGEFTTDLPVGELYVEMFKGFEYESVRKKVTIKPGQKILELGIGRNADWRREGWVTADTHVHFISPRTAWLEAQCEGVNVVNLLASQWGRLFTNVGDLTGRPGAVENDTIVYVGTENRNHMLGHMSMLGTKGLPVFPMCCGGPGEAWLGDPDFMTLAEWAQRNRAQSGVVIRPHYPFCGHTEDPVPILSGLVDALEIGIRRGADFPVQEWYRYLNCGYRVAVAGGTDKMSASMVLGGSRTYAKLAPDQRFSYDSWARAVRAGRTFSTTGPLIDLRVDGKAIGDTIDMSASGGTVEIDAVAQSTWPIGHLEIVCNGQVVAAQTGGRGGARQLRIEDRLEIPSSGWIAARCWGGPDQPWAYMGAHTSPVYVRCGDTRIFNGPAAEHMLALVEGGIEYLNTLSTAFDESSRKRMVRLYKEARAELRDRLTDEAGVIHHHGSGPHHTHGHGHGAGHSHGAGV